LIDVCFEPGRNGTFATNITSNLNNSNTWATKAFAICDENTSYGAGKVLPLVNVSVGCEVGLHMVRVSEGQVPWIWGRRGHFHVPADAGL
jgi:hypothetical protein